MHSAAYCEQRFYTTFTNVFINDTFLRFNVFKIMYETFFYICAFVENFLPCGIFIFNLDVK